MFTAQSLGPEVWAGLMSDALLVLNAGSSSLKFSVFLNEDPPQPLLRGQLEGLLTQPRFVAHDATAVVGEKEWRAGTQLGHEGAIEFLFVWGRNGALGERRIVATGHRVVHGGTKFTAPVLIDAETLAELEALVPLAPLHQPHNVAAVKAAAQLAPTMPQVACFDTSFHRTQPAVAQAFALPRRYAEEGVCRYGFHGLSYEYIASVLPRIDPRVANGRSVVAHLGNGASMCAMESGSSVATTMSFTALDGLMMGTRCGAIDPGVLLYLIDQHGMDARALEQLLYEQSGLLGVSGISSHMRALLASPDACAAEALDLFVYRIACELGSLAAALGGLDALVFTGGIGENAAAIRARVCRDATWLGLKFDEEANARGGPCISRKGSRVTAWVIPTNEELMIALHTRRVLGSALRKLQKKFGFTAENVIVAAKEQIASSLLDWHSQRPNTSAGGLRSAGGERPVRRSLKAARGLRRAGRAAGGSGRTDADRRPQSEVNYATPDLARPL